MLTRLSAKLWAREATRPLTDDGSQSCPTRAATGSPNSSDHSPLLRDILFLVIFHRSDGLKPAHNELRYQQSQQGGTLPPSESEAAMRPDLVRFWGKVWPYLRFEDQGSIGFRKFPSPVRMDISGKGCAAFTFSIQLADINSSHVSATRKGISVGAAGRADESRQILCAALLSTSARLPDVGPVSLPTILRGHLPSDRGKA